MSALAGELGPNRFVLAVPDERTPHTTVIDWIGLPVRVTECVGRDQGLALLDLLLPGARTRRLQEEYIEWRVVRDAHGIRRVELTTELSDYWAVLAAYQPQRTLELIAEFAGDADVPVDAVYRGCDPFDAATTNAQREDAFVATMLSGEGRSPYNDGRAAICCMVQGTNTLRSLLRLALAATNPRVVRDPLSGGLRCLTCEEVIPLISGAAQAGRASDPVLVERLGRLAYEGRLVAFDDPLGVYIQSVEHTRLRTPDGELVPREWFTFGRGVCPTQTEDGRPRWQRVVFEPPPDSGLRVDRLIDVATERPIRYGGQIAELVQAAVVLRVGDPEIEPTGTLEPIELTEAVADASGCIDVRRFLNESTAHRPRHDRC